MNMPKLKRIAAGWLAVNDVPGDGWAAFGKTQDDALGEFYLKLERYQKIDARPFNHPPADGHGGGEGGV